MQCPVKHTSLLAGAGFLLLSLALALTGHASPFFDSPMGGTVSGTGGGGAVTTPGGADRQVQYNDAGAFNGNSGLTYDTSGSLNVANVVSSTNVSATVMTVGGVGLNGVGNGNGYTIGRHGGDMLQWASTGIYRFRTGSNGGDLARLNSTGLFLGGTSNAAAQLQVSGTSLFSGGVAMGTVSASSNSLALLDVYGDISSSGITRTAGVISSAPVSVSLINGNGGLLRIQQNGGGLNFFSNSIEYAGNFRGVSAGPEVSNSSAADLNRPAYTFRDNKYMGLAGDVNAKGVALVTSNTARLVVSDSGAVGIGTTNPTAALEVAGPVSSTALLAASHQVGDRLVIQPVGTYSAAAKLLQSNVSASLYVRDVNDVNFARFIAANDGRLGVGGSWQDRMPEATLHVSGTSVQSGGAVLGAATATSRSAAMLDVYGDVSSSGLVAGSQLKASDRLQIGALGTFSTYLRLLVPGTSSFQFQNNSASPFARLESSLPSGGGLGIGGLWTSSPSATLHVSGTTLLTSGTAIGAAAAASQSSAMLDVYGDVSSTGLLLVNGSRLRTAATNSLYLNSANSTLGTANQNAVFGLGSAPALTSGGGMTALGAESMVNITNQNYNVAVGYRAARLITGANNTMVGTFTGSTQGAGNNNTYIGYAAVGNSDSGSNQLSVANAIWGNVGSGTGNANLIGINVPSPTTALEVAGTVSATGLAITGATNITGVGTSGFAVTNGNLNFNSGWGMRQSGGGNGVYFANNRVGLGTTNPGTYVTAAGDMAVGANLTASSTLHVSGTIQFAGQGMACTSANDGAIRNTTTYRSVARCDQNASGVGVPGWVVMTSSNIVITNTTP